jgi:hypothetical protein
MRVRVCVKVVVVGRGEGEACVSVGGECVNSVCMGPYGHVSVCGGVSTHGLWGECGCDG